GYVAHPDLHSFPTRRSSDLLREGEVRQHHNVVCSPQHITLQTPARPHVEVDPQRLRGVPDRSRAPSAGKTAVPVFVGPGGEKRVDRKSTRLNSSHSQISYAV